MKIKNLILGALLLLFAAGCGKTESDNSTSITTTPGTNAPVVTNSQPATNK